MEPLLEPPQVNGTVKDVINDQLLTPAPSPITNATDPEDESWEEDENTTENNENAREEGNEGNDHIGTKNGHASAARAKKGAIRHPQPSSTSTNEGNVNIRTPRRLSTSTNINLDRDKVLKLSPAKIQELTSSPTYLPIGPAPPLLKEIPALNTLLLSRPDLNARTDSPEEPDPAEGISLSADGTEADGGRRSRGPLATPQDRHIRSSTVGSSSRPSMSSRAASTPPMIRRRQSAARAQLPPEATPLHKPSRLQPLPVTAEETRATTFSTPNPKSPAEGGASGAPSSLPLPPLSISTFLQLELSSDKPSPLYIYRPSNSDFPYESSKVKFERLLNFLLLPPQLERTLLFGALACLDAWLYTFTILPIRFFKALWILFQWWTRNAFTEVRDLGGFVYRGVGRLWRRRNLKAESSADGTPSGEGTRSRRPSVSSISPPISATSPRDSQGLAQAFSEQSRRRLSYRHRRTKSTPSTLLPNHKADILKGLLVIASCAILMRFDASKMYHGIRGQATMKLYVLYNTLEVFDRLFSALGQDVLECLFSRETLERNSDGRSKIFRPLWMFLLALLYNVIHAMALFYQVITLNVAVNSYSNALLTLLMSNQFVEIKGTVFKKFEKENLFQLTCADVVERFQLWLMLLIIAMRNIVEVGLNLGDTFDPSGSGSGSSNATAAPFRSSSILPKSFTILPRWTGQVFGPFLLVLGSEMGVDWLKHAYITKFNNTKPAVYGRFLDVLAKDYYSHAFADQDLTKRLGLPVLPLACLFIRSMVQTYHMFIATHMPLPIPSTATSLTTDTTETSPSTTAALAHIDQLFRRALGRASFGVGSNGGSSWAWNWWSVDDVISAMSMVVIFIGAYLLLLGFKLLLGMSILSFSRRRYRGMKEREKTPLNTEGKRVGPGGAVELQDEKKRYFYADDPEGLKGLKERELKQKEKEEKTMTGLHGVTRYSMVAKRIW